MSSDGPAAPKAKRDELIGMKLGDYVVETPVGYGGMGIVYRAVHPLIGRKVAVKVLREEMAADPEQVERFFKEAQALSGIKHRGIIDIISFGHLADQRQYMIMEYLEGESLEDEVQRDAPMSPARVVALADEILDALSAAHRVGVVHRDMKPSNVFLLRQSNGTQVVKLVDFGLARRVTLGRLDRVGEKASLMAGTPEYLAPEQAQGLAATPRTDLYSFGVMIFEMLTGRLPFEEQGVVQLIEAHCTKPAPRVRDHARNVPDALDELVHHLLQKAPADRPQTASEVRLMMQRVARTLREESTAITALPPARRSNPAAPVLVDRPQVRQANSEAPQQRYHPAMTPTPTAMGGVDPSLAATDDGQGTYDPTRTPEPSATDRTYEDARPVVSPTQRVPGKPARAPRVVGAVLVLAAIAGGVYVVSARTTSPSPVTKPGPLPAGGADSEAGADAEAARDASTQLAGVATAQSAGLDAGAAADADEEDDLAPLPTSVKAKRTPAVCNKGDWQKELLRRHEALLQRYRSDGGTESSPAFGQLKDLYVAIGKASNKAQCPRLALQLEAWRRANP